MIKNRQIDHLVYAVPDLEQAMDDLEKKLGIRPVFGGYHTTKGTKNAVLNLGDDCYLEILAVDTHNTEVTASRWMGVDFIERPQLTRWCLKSNDLQQDSKVLQTYHSAMGQIQGGQRRLGNGDLLQWEMILPLAAPAVEIVPFMCDWRQSAVHATEQMEEHCKLLNLEFTHSDLKALKAVLDHLSLDINVKQGAQVSIQAKIQCPKGIVQI